MTHIFSMFIFLTCALEKFPTYMLSVSFWPLSVQYMSMSNILEYKYEKWHSNCIVMGFSLAFNVVSVKQLPLQPLRDGSIKRMPNTGFLWVLTTFKQHVNTPQNHKKLYITKLSIFSFTPCWPQSSIEDLAEAISLLLHHFWFYHLVQRLATSDSLIEFDWSRNVYSPLLLQTGPRDSCLCDLLGSQLSLWEKYYKEFEPYQ